MLKQWNVLVLFALVALVGAFGCAKEEAEADLDTSGPTGQVQSGGGGQDEPQIEKMMGAGGGQD